MKDIAIAFARTSRSRPKLTTKKLDQALVQDLIGPMKHAVAYAASIYAHNKEAVEALQDTIDANPGIKGWTVIHPPAKWRKHISRKMVYPGWGGYRIIDQDMHWDVTGNANFSDCERTLKAITHFNKRLAATVNVLKTLKSGAEYNGPQTEVLTGYMLSEESFSYARIFNGLVCESCGEIITESSIEKHMSSLVCMARTNDRDVRECSYKQIFGTKHSSAIATAGIDIKARPVEYAWWAPEWVTLAIAQYEKNGGMAGLTLAEYLSKLKPEDIKYEDSE